MVTATRIGRCIKRTSNYLCIHPLRLVIGLLALLVLIVFNPFGIYEFTENRTKELLLKVTSHLYPDIAENQITVVLLNDELRSESEKKWSEWPMPVDKHAEVLKRLVNLQPKVVFSDIFYDRAVMAECEIYENCQGRLANAITTFERSGIPLLIAGNDELLEQREYPSWFLKASRLRVSWDDTKGSMPLIYEDGKSLSPALKIFKIWCIKTSLNLRLRSERNQDCAKLDDGSLSVDYGVPMFVRWSASRAVEKERSILSEWLDSLHTAIQNKDTRVSDEFRLGIDWLPASALRMHVGNENAVEYKNIEDLIRGRVIFLGLDIEGLNDTIYSPVHGYLPGVFVHAMGFSNLLTMGRHYWRNIEGESAMIWAKVTDIAIVVMNVLILAYQQGRIEGGTFKLRVTRKSWYFVVVLASVELLFLGIVLGWRWTLLTIVSTIIICGVISLLWSVVAKLVSLYSDSSNSSDSSRSSNDLLVFFWNWLWFLTICMSNYLIIGIVVKTMSFAPDGFIAVTVALVALLFRSVEELAHHSPASKG